MATIVNPATEFHETTTIPTYKCQNNISCAPSLFSLYQYSKDKDVDNYNCTVRMSCRYGSEWQIPQKEIK